MSDTQAKGSAAVGTVIGQMKDMVEIRDSFQGEQLKYVKNLINPDLTDTELYMFLSQASKSGLNPFNKEIIAVVYNGANGRKVNTIVTRDGKRTVAYRQGGIESITTLPIYIKEVKTAQGTEMAQVAPWAGGRLWGATCTVRRDGKDYVATVPFTEYNTGKNVWASKPETMIKKVAESQALSMAVPELLGVYDEAELDVPTPALMAASDDDQPATEAQKATVKGIVERQGLKVDIDTMTKGEYKQLVVKATSKK